MRDVLLLSGWMGSGKDTVAEYLVREHGYIRVALADALKYKASKASRMPLHYFHDVELKDRILPSGYTPRDLLLVLGSVARDNDPGVWVEAALEDIMYVEGIYDKNIVVTDVRYLNEIERFREPLPECRTVRVERFDTTESDHASERELDSYEFDIHLSNRGSLEALQSEIDYKILGRG